jgi:hypothetical protein
MAAIKSQLVLQLAELFAPNKNEILAPPASEAEIAIFKQKIGLPLAESFYDFYRWQNGSANDPQYECEIAIPFNEDLNLLSLGSILVSKEIFDTHQKDGTFDRWEEGAYWDFAWVPFMENDWYILVIDTKGSFGGKPGQILGFDYKAASCRCIEHESFDKWLETIAELKKANFIFHNSEESWNTRSCFREQISEIHQKVNGEFPFSVDIWPFRRKKHARNLLYPFLLEAIDRGDLAQVTDLINRGVVGIDEVDEYSLGMETPLIYALDKNQIEIAKYLINRGADLTPKDCYGLNAFYRTAQSYFHCQKPDVNLIDMMRRKGAEIKWDYLMYNAVNYSDTEMLSYCFSQGANPN